MPKIDPIVTALNALVESQQALVEGQRTLTGRLDALEAPDVDTHATPVQAVPKRTRIVSASPEVQALRGQIKREAKANLIDRCAGHSPAALTTFVLAGSKAAREFMRGERKEATQREEFALVPNSAAHQYASAIAGGASPKVTATPTRKGRRSFEIRVKETPQPRPAKAQKAAPTRKAATSPKAKNGSALHGSMTDAQLLRSRPRGASQAPAAIRTYLWRTRERIAGRDPMRGKAQA